MDVAINYTNGGRARGLALLIWMCHNMRFHLLAASFTVALVIPVTAFCQLFSENFDVNPTANWTVNGGPSDEEANFFFDYNTIGIPSAPNSTGGTTRGLKLQANETSAIFGGFSV